MPVQHCTIRQPDDWHLHLRDGEMLKGVLPYSSASYRRAIIMPNLTPPLKKLHDIIAYRERIYAALSKSHQFEPLMTMYLSDDSNPEEIVFGYQQGIIKAVKFYPAHATTNSSHGVTAIKHVATVLDVMQQHNIPLLIHGEVTDSRVDIFDREAIFIDNVLLPLMNDFPALRIVLEHITTQESAQLLLDNNDNLAATVTPQHLFLNRNALFSGGMRPHTYCLPILKREKHRQALIKAVTSGSDRFFLGTDSAPHPQNKKESVCGCAGVFNASTALSIYATVFEQAESLHNLEKFTSLNGPKFYGLPVNAQTLTLVKKLQVVPNEIIMPDNNTIIPFLAGEKLEWSIEY